MPPQRHLALSLVDHTDLVVRLVQRELAQRFVRSSFGLWWVCFQPLLLMALYTFLFGVVFRVRLGVSGSRLDYALYVLTGLLPWLSFADGIQRSAGALISNASLVTRVVFPVEVLPAVSVGVTLCNQVIAVALLLPVLATLRPLGTSLVLLPLLFALHAALTLGLGYVLAVWNVRIRDISHLLGSVLTVWLYATPIVYEVTMLPAPLRPFLALNPLTHVVACYRAVLFDGVWPPAFALALFATVGVGTLALGLAIFDSTKSRIGELL